MEYSEMSRQSILQTQLMHMIFPQRPESISADPDLTTNEWLELAEIAKQHRLEPALHSFIQSRGADWAIPDSLRNQWSQAFRTATLRSLWNRERLIRINQVLEIAAIPYAALKGSWLAYHAYPHPALRPMRDVDILVPSDRAIEAFDALIAGGFERIPQHNTPLDIAVTTQKHLPPIRCAVTGVTVEVHTRIFVPRETTDVVPDCIETARLLQRRVLYQVGEVQIPFLSTTDSLLHLILHAAFDHVFNNGPLLISDVALLISSTTIDWDEFWSMADAGGWSRGCGLVLTLAACHYPAVQIEWPTDTDVKPPAAVVAAATELMFQDLDLKSKVVLVSELTSKRSISALVALAGSRVFPPDHVLAAHGGVSVSCKGLWRHYPSWLLTRATAMARAVVVSRHRRGAIHTRRVLQWQQDA
jgi:Uncharacterised nucleotidyltransferase